MKIIGYNYWLSLLALIGIAAASLHSSYGFELPVYFEYLPFYIGVVAIGVALARGGVFGFPFWVTVITAYPIITPYIIRGIFRVAYYSGRALEFQVSQVEVLPLLIAAMSSMFFALAITGKNIRPGFGHNSYTRDAGEERFLWLFMCSIFIVFFAWLTEPGPPIGLVTYETMRTYRIPGTDFAGAAWVVFSMVGLAIYLNITTRAVGKYKRESKYLYWGVVLFSVTYLLLHARRSEVSGYLILLFCVFGPTIPRWRVYALSMVLLFALSVVGYVRDYGEVIDTVKAHYLHLPGGAGNIIVGYITAFELKERDEINITPGETYLGHIERIPPAFIGLSRPPIIYDYVHEKVPLSGGEYFLIEPYLNFGATGIIAYLLIAVLCINCAINRIAVYVRERTGLVYFIIASSFMAMVFRMFWYGVGATVKAIIIAGALGLIMAVVYQAAVGAKKMRRGLYVDSTIEATKNT